jgi:hypothetical protein
MVRASAGHLASSGMMLTRAELPRFRLRSRWKASGSFVADQVSMLAASTPCLRAMLANSAGNLLEHLDGACNLSMVARAWQTACGICRSLAGEDSLTRAPSFAPPCNDRRTPNRLRHEPA